MLPPVLVRSLHVSLVSSSISCSSTGFSSTLIYKCCLYSFTPKFFLFPEFLSSYLDSVVSSTPKLLNFVVSFIICTLLRKLLIKKSKILKGKI